MKNWEEKEIGQILKLNYGWSLPDKKRTAGDFPVYGSNGIVGWHNMPLVKTKGLIVGRKGSAGNVHYSRKPFCPIDTTFFVTQEDTSLDIEFLFFLLMHANLKRVLGDVGVPGLNRDVAYKEKIKYPTDLSEQQRIAYVLSMVQTATTARRLIKLTRELKSALMHVMHEGLRGEKQKMTEIGPVPESWEIKPFEQFTTLQRGKDLTKDNFKNGLVPVAGSNGIIGYHDVAFVKDPGVTVGRSGSVGKVIFYDQEFWAHNTSLYVKDFHGNDPRFAAYYLEVLELGRFKTGASVPTLDRNSFKHFPIAVPSKDEQIEIGNNLSVVDKKIEITSRRKAKLEELFRTLLHQLMTGQTRVNEIDM